MRRNESRSWFYTDKVLRVEKSDSCMFSPGCHFLDTPCAGLRDDKNRPAAFPGRVTWKATKPGFGSVMMGRVFVFVLLCFRCTCYCVASFAVVSTAVHSIVCKDPSLKWPVMCRIKLNSVQLTAWIQYVYRPLEQNSSGVVTGYYHLRLWMQIKWWTELRFCCCLVPELSFF